MSPVSNMLVEGVWREGVRQTQTESGEYKRQETTFRNRVPPEEVERGRYHLYISRSCPWAHGVALVRALQGLDGAVSLNVVDPVRKGNGWEFSPEIGGCTPDTANGCDYLYEVYAKADPNYTGHVNVPVLWDTQEEAIVNNESIEIMRNFATVFTDISQHSVDLYPEDKRDEIDRIIEAIYEPINNGVYRARALPTHRRCTKPLSPTCSTRSTTGNRSSRTNATLRERSLRSPTFGCFRRSSGSTPCITLTSSATSAGSWTIPTSGTIPRNFTNSPGWLTQ